MKNDITELISNFRNPDDNKFRKKLSVFLICFVISMFIWILVNFSKEDELIIPYKIAYINPPDDKMLVNTPDSIIEVRLRAKGFRLISLKFFKKKPLFSLNLRGLEMTNLPDGFESKLTTSELINNLKKQLYFQNQIVAVSPDTLSFIFKESVIVKVPVVFDLKISYSKPYQLHGNITSNPDSISIKVLKEKANNLLFIKTEKKMLKDIDENQKIKLKLVVPDEYREIVLSHQDVEISIPVEKFTESSVEVPIMITSDDLTGQVKLFPERVKIVYQVALVDFEKVESGMFITQVNLNKATLSDYRKLKVEVVQSPDFIKISRIEPERVEFLIQK
ncbi:hypothetical protein ACFLRZ_01250 [Bacteroidota bacterium]